MKKLLLGLCCLASFGIAYGSENQTVTFKDRQAAYKGPEEFFTGDVQVKVMTDTNDTTNYGTAYVTFAPGARSAWHTHPAGQTLIVVSGKAWTQEWNGKKTEAKKGDIIWCPTGVKHWHGASSDGEMTHLTITGVKDGKNVEWLEKVTDEQYSAD